MTTDRLADTVERLRAALWPYRHTFVGDVDLDDLAARLEAAGVTVTTPVAAKLDVIEERYTAEVEATNARIAALRGTVATAPTNGLVRCPLCADMEHEDDMVGGVCLTCADGITFAQHARRAAIIPTPRPGKCICGRPDDDGYGTCFDLDGDYYDNHGPATPRPSLDPQTTAKEPQTLGVPRPGILADGDYDIGDNGAVIPDVRDRLACPGCGTTWEVCDAYLLHSPTPCCARCRHDVRPGDGGDAG